MGPLGHGIEVRGPATAKLSLGATLRTTARRAPTGIAVRVALCRNKNRPSLTKPMQRKIFWTTFMGLGLIADFALPIWWALGATIPIFCISWWVAYRSEWF